MSTIAIRMDPFGKNASPQPPVIPKIFAGLTQKDMFWQGLGASKDRNPRIPHVITYMRKPRILPLKNFFYHS